MVIADRKFYESLAGTSSKRHFLWIGETI